MYLLFFFLVSIGLFCLLIVRWTNLKNNAFEVWEIGGVAGTGPTLNYYYWHGCLVILCVPFP